MDTVMLHILCRELEEDHKVLLDASAKAAERLVARHPGHLEAAAFELNRAYNVLEKAFERVCGAFENHFEKRGDYHEQLISRISLEIPGFRPAFLPPKSRPDVRELKNFRHIFRHAYDLELRADRVSELAGIVLKLTASFRTWIEEFEANVPKFIKLPDAGQEEE